MPEEPITKTEEPKEETPTEPVKTEPVENKQETPQEQVDWEKRYKDLQSEYNKRDGLSKENTELKQNLENWKKLGAAIEADPELFEVVKKKLVGEAPKEPNGEAKPDETKLFIRDNIIDRFEDRYGIKSLDQEKAQALRTKVGTELQTMLDPLGTGEDLNDLMLKVPLNKLPMYFEKAYKLATADDSEEQARLRALAEASSNANGMIGSIPSSSVKGDTITLNDKQKEAAKKLGISEKDYADYLKKEQ